MLERLKSPVVIIQLVSLLAGGVLFFAPELSEEIKVVAGIVIGAIQIVAGLNNPTDRENF